MKIHKQDNGKWIEINESEVNNFTDCLTDAEKEDFAAFRNTQDIGESFADLVAAKPFIDLLVTKYGDKTFCVIDNTVGCGLISEVYWRLEDGDGYSYLAFWTFDVLKNQLSNDNYSQEINVVIRPFSILKTGKDLDSLFTERFVRDLLLQI
jgi:hypothetical protein